MLPPALALRKLFSQISVPLFTVALQGGPVGGSLAPGDIGTSQGVSWLTGVWPQPSLKAAIRRSSDTGSSKTFRVATVVLLESDDSVALPTTVAPPGPQLPAVAPAVGLVGELAPPASAPAFGPPAAYSGPRVPLAPPHWAPPEPQPPWGPGGGAPQPVAGAAEPLLSEVSPPPSRPRRGGRQLRDCCGGCDEDCDAASSDPPTAPSNWSAPSEVLSLEGFPELPISLTSPGFPGLPWRWTAQEFEEFAAEVPLLCRGPG